MGIQEALSTAYAIAKTIYDYIKLAKEVDERRQDQLSRILVIMEALDPLQNYPDQAQIAAALNGLIEALTGLQLFLDSLVSNGKLKKLVSIFKSKKHTEILNEHSAKISEKMQDLSVAMGAKHIVDSGRRHEAVENRLDEVFKKSDEFISKLNSEVIVKLEAIYKKHDVSYSLLLEMMQVLEEINNKPTLSNTPNETTLTDARVALKKATKLDQEGKNDPSKYREAFLFYKAAAKNNESKAQGRLGYFYHEGRGTHKNISKALFWLEKAAPHDPHAKKNLEIIKHKMSRNSNS